MFNSTEPEDSSFRCWFRNCLKSLSGNVVEWPYLLRQIFAEEFKRLRSSDQYYSGAVFHNRDDEVRRYCSRDSADEEILVYRLYAAVHEKTQGVLTIGTTPVWLFSIEVPNQGKSLSNKTKKRRADLLGLRQDGSLVVFECKGPSNNKDSPLYGLLEGLDYLGCLLTPRNLTRLNDALQEWIVDFEPNASEPSLFHSVIPDWPSFAINPEAEHSVVVLAPQSYFDLHVTSSSSRPGDWWLLSDRLVSQASPDANVSLDFAVGDFDQGTATWFEPSSHSPIAIFPEQQEGNPVGLPRNLVWFDGREERAVVRVRHGAKNTRIRIPDGTTVVVPNNQLRPSV